MNKLTQIFQFAVLLLTCLAPTAHATFELTMAGGTDNNPYKLMDGHAPQFQRYFYSALAYKKQYKSGFYLDGKVSNYDYTFANANKNKQQGHKAKRNLN